MGILSINYIKNASRFMRKYKKSLGVDNILKTKPFDYNALPIRNLTIDTVSFSAKPAKRVTIQAKQAVNKSATLDEIRLGPLFKDATTKSCEVSIKPSGWNKEFVEFYPDSYTKIATNGERTTKSFVELDYFEIANKGKGDGSKKLKEIINFAKDKTDGRMVVSAVQFDKQSPVLFYYRNGLRSTNPTVNAKIEKVAKGELPKSELPENLFMFLPTKPGQ